MIRLYENFRAVFYTPFYAAFALGAYEGEGLEVQLRQHGPDATPAQVALGILAGEADFAWGGPMRVLSHLDRDPACGLVCFCEVVGRDPFYLVGARPNPQFRLADLAGLTVATVSEVPTPWLCMQHDLREQGLDPASVRRIADGTMEANARALREGRVDVIQVFEPYVEQLVTEGAGHLWHAFATRGPTAYTCFYTTRRVLERSADALQAVTRAMQATLAWIHSHSADELADKVAPYFPRLPRDVLTRCLARYLSFGTWNRDPLLSEAGFLRLRDSLRSGGFIRRDIPFEECVDNRFADRPASGV